ncbi:PP2C family protein-serine/threonine phosphatase [Sedimentimonas flavescens]|uniref:PP2C family protein-serine/threonine phosphatase n=1 Tax=Sedimentimonas flavescens TaxID=2851012 RepID=UPI0021A641D5|nr:protein phosphatase 2C domain-containing protein [Sedimentimonas flavescens]MCT2538912.1 protein phosphatase 2C domain-containing protein [Sedimentimonas flavescens]
MLDEFEFHYDAATALAQGQRDQQEDAVATNFPDGSGLGFIVLADGMGGYAAGELASQIVVAELCDHLRAHSADPTHLESNIGPILRDALERANDLVARYTTMRPDLYGMGATVVAPIIVGNRLYWISVGDSPLYLLRGNRMFRLNQEHSMARQMEMMVATGELTRLEADQNPDRFCLTSVLIGESIPEIDCRDVPVELQDGDIVIAASDGLQFLDEAHIAKLVHEHRDSTSAEINARLMQEILDLDDPDQDNVSICVLKISKQVKAAMPPRNPPPDHRSSRWSTLRKTVLLRVHRPEKRVAFSATAAYEG